MEVLQRQPELVPLMKSFFYSGPGGGGIGILPINIANWLLAKSISLDGGPEEALSSLENFARENSAYGFRVVAIYGVYIPEEIKLNENTRIVPVWNLPPSLGVDHLAEAIGHFVFQLPMGGEDLTERLPAISALVQRFRMSPAVVVDQAKMPDWHGDHPGVFKELEEIGAAFGLLPGAIPQVVSQWVETDGVDAIPGLTGGSTGEFEIMEVIPRRFQWMKPLSADLVSDRLGSYMKLPSEVRRKLNTPLRRLAMVGARREPLDKAIELGICLESLFGEGDKSEIAHKIAVRGSIIVSSAKQDRIHNYRILKSAYNLRSKAVHGGEFDDSRIAYRELNLTGTDVINRAEEIARVSMNKIVDSGAIPDWTAVDLAIHDA